MSEKVRNGKPCAVYPSSGGRLLAVSMALLIAGGAWGSDGFHWCAVGNDASGLFCLSGQEFENTSRRVYTCVVGSYAPSKYDACIGGFAKKNNGWIADRDIAFTPHLTIPEKITYGHLWKGVSGPVTVLRPGAFKGYKELLSVSIPSTIQSYGSETFAGCTSLQSVKLHCRVVAPYMFRKCTSLRHIELQEGVVTNICPQAFLGSGLLDISIPDSVPEVGYGAFMDCVSLAKVEVSHGVRKLGDGSFKGCTGIRSLQLPKIQLGYEAFKNCTGLTTLTLHGGTKVGSYAFGSCKGLKTVVVEGSDHDMTIGQYAFAFCRNLESIDYCVVVVQAGRQKKVQKVTK